MGYGNNEFGNTLSREYLDQRAQEIRQAQREVRELTTYSPPPHGAGERSFVTIQEAIGTLGLLEGHRKIANGLMESLVSGAAMIEIVKEAQGAGIPQEAIREMLRRGTRMIHEARHTQRPVLSPRTSGRLDATKSLTAASGTLMKASKRQKKKNAKKQAAGGMKKPKSFTTPVGKMGGFKNAATPPQYWYPGKGVTSSPHADDHEDVHAAHETETKKREPPHPDVHKKYLEIDAKAREAGIHLDGVAQGHHTMEDMDQMDAALDRVLEAKKKKDDAAREQEKKEKYPNAVGYESMDTGTLEMLRDSLKLNPGINPEEGKKTVGEIDAILEKRKAEESEAEESSVGSPTGNQQEGSSESKSDNEGSDQDEFDGLAPADQAKLLEQQMSDMSDMIDDAELAGADPALVAAQRKHLDKAKKDLKAIYDKAKGKKPKDMTDLERLKQTFYALRFMAYGLVLGMLMGGGPGAVAGLAGGSAKSFMDQKKAKALNKQFKERKTQQAALASLHKELKKHPKVAAKEESEEKPEEKPAEGSGEEADPAKEEAAPNRAQRRAAAAEERKSNPAKPKGEKEKRKKKRKDQRKSRRKNRTKKSLYLDLSTDRLVLAKAFTVEDVHDAADDAGVDWDNNDEFMDLCESIVGERHLDDMSERQLRVVADVVAGRMRKATIEKAGPFIGPRGGRWADSAHTIPYQEDKPKKRRAAAPKPKRKPPGSQLPPDVLQALKDLKVDKLPQATIPQSDIQVDLSNPNTTALLKWKDVKGKTQSGYTPEFHAANAKKKWERVMEWREKAPAVIRQLGRELKKATPGTKKHQGLLVATIVAHTGLRPGGPNMKEGNHGVANLTSSHVKITGNKVEFDFIGKQSKRNTATLRNKAVAEALSHYVKGGNKRNAPMFSSTAVTEARLSLPEGLNLKDFRTIIATDTAMEVLDNLIVPPPLTGNKRKDKRLLAKSMLEASRRVADVINNTPQVARSTYVHPEVFRQWAITRAGADPSLFDEVK